MGIASQTPKKKREETTKEVTRARRNATHERANNLTRAVKAETKVVGQKEQKLGGKPEQHHQHPTRPDPPGVWV